MTRIIDLTVGAPDSCSYCGKTHEEDGCRVDLRPYGKDGAWICYDCGMKPENEATTNTMFGRILKENDIVISEGVVFSGFNKLKQNEKSNASDPM